MKREDEIKLREQMHIEEKRGDTWLGFRPTIFKSKKKYNRKREKGKFQRELERCLYES